MCCPALHRPLQPVPGAGRDHVPRLQHPGHGAPGGGVVGLALTRHGRCRVCGVECSGPFEIVVGLDCCGLAGPMWGACGQTWHGCMPLQLCSDCDCHVAHPARSALATRMSRAGAGRWAWQQAAAVVGSQPHLPCSRHAMSCRFERRAVPSHARCGCHGVQSNAMLAARLGMPC